MKRKCLECQEILHGRSDKKFCGDYCRNTYNNKLNSESNKTIRKINKILKKNYTILKNNYQKQQKVLSKTHLINLGFDFEQFTGIESNNRKKCYIVYDRGYIPLTKQRYIIIKKSNLI